MDIIRTHKLTKYYGKSRGIIDLELSVKEGDFFGFIGPNGAGKSTTIRTLLGLISPTSGSAEIFGKDIADFQQEVLADIGFMPSEAMFYSGMRARDIIRLSADLRGKDCTDEAGQLCDTLQLDVSRKIDELSLGNRKKVAIVCALQHRPRLYILDEPTSGLDPLIQRAFFSLLEERNKKGATVFLSSHVLSEIQRYCSCAAVIRDGRLIACDSVDMLTDTNAKRVTVHGTIRLDDFKDIRNLEITGDRYTFLYGGSLQPLLKRLSESEISDLTIAEPDLEEVFMHYYEGGDPQ